MDNEQKVTMITASTVVVEVTDAETGKTFRRELPIDYYETANCIRLRGENMEGSPSELVFYSSLGMSRLKGLMGGGPDKDPCGGHSNA